MFQSSSIAEKVTGKLSDNRSAQEDRRPLTVLQVIPRMDEGGAERGVMEITEAIAREGGRAIIATSGGKMLPRVPKAGGQVIAMNLETRNILNLWQNARLLTRLIRDLEVDVVHARAAAPAWSAHLAAKRTGAHFVTTYHDTVSAAGLLGRRGKVMTRGQPVIAVSDFVRDQIIQQLGVSPDQVVTIPRGADVNVFSEETVGNERAVKLANEWGLLDDARPMVLLPDALTRTKGSEDLISAAQRLREMRGDDFLILLTGAEEGTSYEMGLRRTIEKMGLDDVVRVAASTGDSAAAYKLASVVVSASREPEASCQPVIEAQAMGRPVIVTDHGAAPETVRHGDSGWLYPPGDVECLTDVLNKALNLDPSQRAHMGMAARARIHSGYTLSAMQRATLEVYEQVSGRTFAKLV
ncbi:MAG: glycosyltransferase family 4 protein [Paracoccaceae bacterium]|nr:glycosyltransferase family 4 protein [Paracoccaceae bacterium]